MNYKSVINPNVWNQFKGHNLIWDPKLPIFTISLPHSFNLLFYVIPFVTVLMFSILLFDTFWYFCSSINVFDTSATLQMEKLWRKCLSLIEDLVKDFGQLKKEIKLIHCGKVTRNLTSFYEGYRKSFLK